MWFIEEQQRTRLSWKHSQSHLSHILLYGFRLKVNCLQGQQQSNSNDCGVFAIAFAVGVCIGLLPYESCYDVTEMRKHLSISLQLEDLSPFPNISRRVPRCRLFQPYIDIFYVCGQNFFMSDSKDNVDNLMARCTICYEWFHKKCMSISKKVFSFLQKMNIKKGNVVSTNCNVYNETLHLWNFFVFSSPRLWMSGFL